MHLLLSHSMVGHRIRQTYWNLHGNFRPEASFSQNMLSGHATDYFLRRVDLGQANIHFVKFAGKLVSIVLFSFLLIILTVFISSGHLPKHCRGHLLMLMLGSKYGWQGRILHTPGRESMCAGLCDFRSESCSARVSGQAQAIFRQN